MRKLCVAQKPLLNEGIWEPNTGAPYSYPTGKIHACCHRKVMLNLDTSFGPDSGEEITNIRQLRAEGPSRCPAQLPPSSSALGKSRVSVPRRLETKVPSPYHTQGTPDSQPSEISAAAKDPGRPPHVRKHRQPRPQTTAATHSNRADSHLSPLRLRARRRASRRLPRLTAPAPEAVHFGTCSFPSKKVCEWSRRQRFCKCVTSGLAGA
jgi:hypothetical protein